jgi:hypothetical protein
MDTLDTLLNSFVESIKPYFPDSPKRNPKLFNDFLNYYSEHDNIDDLFEKYHFLNYLNKKYGFIRNNEICVKLEFELIQEYISNLPNEIVSEEYYENMLVQYENILEKKKDRRRFEKSIDFICSIFQSFCTGKQEFDHLYVQVPIALCVGFGRAKMNRNMRRLVYDRLDHSKIISSEIESPLQASMLKLYCRFVNFCGKQADIELMTRLNDLCYQEKQHTKEENNRDYNKRVRLFHSIHMNVKPLYPKCHIDYIEKHFYVRDGYLYNKQERIICLDHYKDDIQREVVGHLNKNYNTVIIYNYPYKEQLIIEAKGRTYIKRIWNHTTKKITIEIY